MILLAAVTWVEIENRNTTPPLRISEYTQLTHNGHAGWVAGIDGSRLYLTDLDRFSVQQVAVSGGEIESGPSITLPNPFLFNVSPDGSTFLVQSFKIQTPSLPLYTVQVVGGEHRYLADAVMAGGTWSPDGKFVAYSTPNGDIDIINSDGTGAHKLASVGGAAYPLSWSPDGSTIRFSRDNLRSLWEITSSGSNLHQLLPAWHPSEQKCCGSWSPDGEFFAFLSGPPGPEIPEAQIYALDERRGLFRQAAKDPIQLTSGPIRMESTGFQQGREENLRRRFDKEGRVGSFRSEIQPVSALSWRHLRRFNCLLQRRSVRSVYHLPGWHSLESEPGWKRPRPADQSPDAAKWGRVVTGR